MERMCLTDVVPPDAILRGTLYGMTLANSMMADNTAGQLELALHVNKASAKAF